MPHKKEKKYTLLTKAELRISLGINFVDIIKMPSYRDFWSSDPIFRNDFVNDFVTNAMSRDRFGWILVHLHTNDNEGWVPRDHPVYDGLYRV